MRNKTKCGLRISHLCFFEPKTFLRESERRKLRQGEKIKIVAVISSHFLLLSDQASWVKKIRRGLR